MQKEFKVSRMPVRTWRWLGVNEADVVLYAPERAAGEAGPVPEVVFPEDPTGSFVTEEMAAFLDGADSRRYIKVGKDRAEQGPIVLDLRLSGEDPVLVDDIVIEAEEGAAATVILKYSSGDGEPVHHCGRTRIWAHRNAQVTLVKAQMLGGAATHTDAVGAVLEEGASLHAIIAELGAATSLSSGNVVLRGEGSAVDLGVLYLGDAARSLDMSYRVEHRGEGSISHIQARGILMEQSRKVFRDTLDFVRGASGSKGREEESVLMLSPKARNISVPVLLCGEDKVEGEHAASSGRPNEEVIFYMMSRGISQVDAETMLAQATFSAIVEKIPDPRVQEEILARVNASIARGRSP